MTQRLRTDSRFIRRLPATAGLQTAINMLLLVTNHVPFFLLALLFFTSVGTCIYVIMGARLLVNSVGYADLASRRLILAGYLVTMIIIDFVVELLRSLSSSTQVSL